MKKIKLVGQCKSANFCFSIGSVDFDFQDLISWVEPVSSIENKSNMIEKNRKCALWRQDVRTAGCVP